MTVDAELVAMMNAVFADHRTAHGPTAGPELWDQLRTLGLARLTGAEESGGSGAGWHEAAELMAAAVRSGVRVGLPEHDLLACWLLEVAGIAVDDNTRTVALLDESGTATAVPWASTAQRIVLVWRTQTGEHAVSDVDTGQVRITAGANMIGEPRDTVSADVPADGATVSEATVTTLHLKAALVRAVQVCAAMDTILELAVEHSSSRIQFGRPLAKFQAIQHMISDIAAEATLARTATEAALTAAVGTTWSAPHLEFLVAVARSCCGHAASVVVRNAHQVFGAIGTTAEHRLHEYTRAALAWRGEFGSVRSWDERVTTAALQAGGAGLWELITS
ncbi:acyl-CoA dehydrogenase family protein [Mycolicibacterium smegmatis]|uniref:acyl-CoA dehydrogenase family protein n=1 Tax=Mycolicibacterium smegmatis TaxID=1772 RepID=UPI001E56B8DD|nr:acyl-CoA dehydrogenase family protein [Mycolicibacterium smegmatis]MCP2624346.1 acyl-CoA dehydrogenase family protein [Mycolicibacterium smegmatis]UGU32073.1 acyl-CoA dehydrogenase [Mycolicibacterium smegmatis]ULN37808.1 acyl-CoA dehydrogenase [Mycolicibacterium smegmatis]ULN72955.1 acyl-CoA dehydrogenase [Mycolicibacterium smegmatis]